MAINSTLFLISFFLISYVLGSIPFAHLVAKTRGIDLRKVGSGNFGATNVYRAMGLFAALFVFALDVFKAFIPIYFAINYFPGQPLLHILIGFTAVVGHSLSPFIGFKGGKGVACGVGVLAAIAPLVSAIVFVISATLIAVTRYVAPVSIFSALLTPVLLYVFDTDKTYIIAISIVCAFIIYRHRSNIRRLIQGKENKV